jgi:hypothetical protein
MAQWAGRSMRLRRHRPRIGPTPRAGGKRTLVLRRQRRCRARVSGERALICRQHQADLGGEGLLQQLHALFEGPAGISSLGARVRNGRGCSKLMLKGVDAHMPWGQRRSLAASRCCPDDYKAMWMPHHATTRSRTGQAHSLWR